MHHPRQIAPTFFLSAALVLGSSGCWWPPGGSDPGDDPATTTVSASQSSGGSLPATTGAGAGGSHCGPGEGASGGGDGGERPTIPTPGVGSSGSGGSDRPQVPPPSSGSGSGGAGGSDETAGAGSGGSTPQVPVPLVPVLATGVELQAVVLNQGVRHTLMQDGVDVADASPVVAGREALVRVFYESNGSYNGKPVEVSLTLGEHVVRQSLTLMKRSSDADLLSTVNFRIPGDWVTPGADYRVTMTQLGAFGSGGNSAAAYPMEQTAPIRIEESNTKIEITLVPVVYDADGSGRLPVTDAAQLQLYRDAIYSHFPAESVQVSVREPLRYDQPVEAGGEGWSSLLAAIADLRFRDNAPRNRYYYGVVAPQDSFASYCASGCVTGLGYLTPEGNNWARAAIGLGFRGGRFADTAVHELGHNHGREHAPCGGPSNVDASFPYSGGSVGGWGYDLVHDRMMAPNLADFMGYCDPAWVSDYTYGALYQRLRRVGLEVGAAGQRSGQSQARVFDRVSIDSRGNRKWLKPVRLDRSPAGMPVSVRREFFNGTAKDASAVMVQHDHLPGGVLFVARENATPAPHSLQVMEKGSWRYVPGRPEVSPLVPGR